MRRLCALSGLVAGLLGCAAPTPSGESRDMRRVDFACENGESVQMRYFPLQGVAVLVRGGRTTELQQQRVASGFLYSSPAVAVRGKGNEILIEEGAGARLRCNAR